MSDELKMSDLLELSADCLPDPSSYQYYKGLLKLRIIINEYIMDNLL